MAISAHWWALVPLTLLTSCKGEGFQESTRRINQLEQENRKLRDELANLKADMQRLKSSAASQPARSQDGMQVAPVIRDEATQSRVDAAHARVDQAHERMDQLHARVDQTHERIDASHSIFTAFLYVLIGALMTACGFLLKAYLNRNALRSEGTPLPQHRHPTAVSKQPYRPD